MTSDHLRATAAPSATQRAAQFDASVGLALATACPRCGAGVPSATSDFCEHCSAHLYPGHCVFCLTAAAPSQAFCRACGLPPEGVTCGACGTFSRFDFCPNPECGAGLTPRAAQEIERLEHDPEVQEAFADLDAIAAVLATVESTAAPPDEALPVAQVTTPSASHSGTALPPIIEASATPAIDARAAAAPARPSLAKLRAAAEGARSAEAKARVRLLAQQAAEEAMQGVSSRPFPSAQEARAAGTALQVALRCRVVTERLETIAWRCNTFGTEHPEPGGMSLCSDPSGGGVPIMRVVTEVDDRSTEFTA